MSPDLQNYTNKLLTYLCLKISNTKLILFKTKQTYLNNSKWTQLVLSKYLD